MARSSRTVLPVSELCRGILAGKRAVLAKAITLAESTLQKDQQIIEKVLKKLLPHTGQSIRIAVTGVPGVGKSTFIETFGELLALEGKRVGVLTVDPTSQKTKGSILGDKTRMERLSRNPHVFIRPSPSGLALGGVSYHTREAILLCEAAGFDVILIETVGVGQSETIVRGIVDFFLLLMITGAGDELQGIKKGIMEMADGIAITKADGTNINPAKQAQADAMQALHFQTPSLSGWKPKVLATSSLENKGIAEVWRMIQEFQQHTTNNGYLNSNRQWQQAQWLDEIVEGYYREMLNQPFIQKEKKQLLKKILNNSLLPADAAKQLWGYAIPGKKKKN